MSNEVQVSEGSLNESAVKGYFSELVFRAICYQNRLHNVKDDKDYGTDLKILELFDINGALDSGNPLINFQVKSTYNYQEDDKNIKYKLSNKCFNSMSRRNKQQREPLILILCCLSKKTNDWIKYDSPNLLNCEFYWYHSKEVTLKDNVDSRTTIYIPKKNQVKENTIKKLVDEFRVKPSLK